MECAVPFNYASAITKHDSTNIVEPADGTNVSGVYVGGTGNLVAVFPDGSTATFTGVPAGAILPISIIRVNSTNTTASAMLALFRI